MTGGWPVEFGGVTETLVATLGPNGRWNVAALGVHAGGPPTARTWGSTRTRRNFRRTGEGYVQFVDDPELFVEAALGIEERADPVLPEAAAWVAVEVERIDAGESAGTEWAEWALRATDGEVVREAVPTIDRGFNAVIEATVAASRLGVEGYERAELTDRLAWLESVVERCGDGADRAAFERLVALSDWR